MRMRVVEFCWMPGREGVGHRRALQSCWGDDRAGAVGAFMAEEL